MQNTIQQMFKTTQFTATHLSSTTILGQNLKIIFLAQQMIVLAISQNGWKKELSKVYIV